MTTNQTTTTTLHDIERLRDNNSQKRAQLDEQAGKNELKWLSQSLQK